MPHLIRGAAAAQIEDGAGGEGILGRGDPGNHRRGLLDLEEAAARNAGQHVIDMLLADLIEDAGLGGGRGDAVDGDVVVRDLLGQGLGEGDDAGFGGAVRRGE